MNSTSRGIVLVCCLGLFTWLMSSALFASGMFAFRDAAHYYYPLFEFVSGEWAAGRVPLWNPHENLGQPLAADPTSSVFYPGKLVFALPLSYTWAFKTYVMAHLLLAAWAAYCLARHGRASIEAAGVCAISYAFSGNVLFQYCNVVFLVGAAWLPLAVLAAERMLVEGAGIRGQGSGDRGEGTRRVGWAVCLGTILALMVLGGDPQMAYNAGLLVVMYACWLGWYSSSLSVRQRLRIRARRAAACVKRTLKLAPGGSRGLTLKPPVPKSPVPKPPASAGGYWSFALHKCASPLTRSRPALLFVAAAVAFVLAAVQVLPSTEFSRRCGRTADRSLDGLLCRNFEPGTHQEHVYHFSVGPWRLAEYLWPNLSGRQFPIHRRWLDVIPAEGRIWTPSLYMGLLPLLLAVSAMRFRGRRGEPRGLSPRADKRIDRSPSPADTRDGWLSWSVVLAVVASFGWYGLGWLIQEIRFAAGGEAAGPAMVGAPVGGLYWLMTVLLPGYASFRYPAKLLVVAALGLSVLAARGWDRTLTEPSARFRRGLLWLGGLSFCGAIAALAIRPFWGGWLAGVEPDVLFGPLDTTGAANDLLGALFQTAILCGAFWWLLGKNGHAKKGTVPFLPRWVPAIALVLVAVDLAMANRWMIVCAPAEQWEEPSKLAAAIEDVGEPTRDTPKNEPVSLSTEPYRLFRHPIWMRPVWQTTASPTRLDEAMRWDRDTLWPKYNLASNHSIAEVHGAMMSLDYAEWLRKRGQVPFSLARYVILPGDQALPGATRIPVDVEDVSLWQNPRHLPRAWIVHQVDVLEPLPSRDPAEVRRRTEQVLYVDGQPRDMRNSAVVESSGGTGPARQSSGESPRPGNAGQAGPPGEESCCIVHYDPLRVEIEAELARPGLVVLCDQFYPGWRLEVKTAGHAVHPAPILRANRVMRGAWLPAGKHRLVYRYRPASFLWGAILSGLGWLAMACCVGWRLQGRRAGNR